MLDIAFDTAAAMACRLQPWSSCMSSELYVRSAARNSPWRKGLTNNSPALQLFAAGGENAARLKLAPPLQASGCKDTSKPKGQDCRRASAVAEVFERLFCSSAASTS